MKLNININDEPVILLDKLNLDDLKAKYSWIFNAKIKNAILGEQGNKLVWYSGEWIDGEWYDGIWYSGNFYNGIWEKGEWYSWDLDMFQLMDNKLIIKEKNNEASKFHQGLWKDGIFNGGIFGNDEIINLNNYGNAKTIWEKGNFNNGIFINSLWKNGTWSYGEFNNSLWLKGVFFNGTFKGLWEDGNFNGGDFIEGIWKKGEFNRSNPNIASRFGVYPDLSVDEDKCIWENGTFIRGEFYSGDFKDENGNPIPSNNNKISIWKNGIWKNGYWFGGQFQNGTWMNGIWYGGVWGTWATEWSDPSSYEQKRVDPFSGTTDDFQQINLETLSASTNFDRVYIGSTTGSQELEVSGTTYMDGDNNIYEYDNIPPFYYHTNYELLKTGFTSYLNDSSFDIDYSSGSTNNESPWVLSGYTSTIDNTFIISGSSFYFEQLNSGNTNIIKQDNFVLPAFSEINIEAKLNSWINGSSGDKIILVLNKRQSGGTISNQEIDLLTYNNLITGITLNLDDDVISIELKLEASSNLNKISMDYLNINNIPYFHSESQFPLTGVIDLEGHSNKIDNQEGDIHKLYITVNTLENVDLNVRLIDICGNTSYVEEEGSTILKDYFKINNTGFFELIFYENTNLDEVFLNFTSTKKIFNQPYEIEFKCHLITFRTSKLITNSSNERIYSGDKIFIRTILQFDTVKGENNNYKFYLTDLNNNIISDSYIIQEESDFSDPDYIVDFVLTSTQKKDNYRLNIDIYRETDYSWFNSNIQVQTLRILEDNEWINPQNIIDSDSDTYTYYRDRTGRNDVNVLILSGFTFDIPKNSEIKGLKFKVTRSGFYDNSENVLGSVKDRVFNVDYKEFRNIISSNLNFPNPNEFSIPTSFKKEIIDYGQYEYYFGIEPFNWTLERINELRLVYQPQSYKSLRLSDGLYIEGRLYRIQARIFYQTSPTWENGIWENGIWINGIWKDGNFIKGTFLDGEILGGIINSQF